MILNLIDDEHKSLLLDTIVINSEAAEEEEANNLEELRKQFVCMLLSLLSSLSHVLTDV